MRLDELPAGLRDERGGKVVFVSHCILNQNVRYLGGAFRRGAVDEAIDAFVRDGVGIVQLPCPEQAAWGGVFKPLLLTMFGSRGTLRYRLRAPLLALFGWYSRWVYRRLARSAARDIADYVRSGFTVVGIVGVAGSPSCGVRSTLDLERALGVAADVPVAALTRAIMNDRIVAASVVAGSGWFIEALRRELVRRRIDIPFFEIAPSVAAPSSLAERDDVHA